jgi:hypothetical protein
MAPRQSVFGTDPCRHIVKHLDVAVVCGSAPENASVLVPSTWQATAGPYLADDPFAGATTDFRFFRQGSPGPLSPVVASTDVPSGSLQSLMIPPAKATAVISPQSVHRLPNGNVVYDFGQNGS